MLISLFSCNVRCFFSAPNIMRTEGGDKTDKGRKGSDFLNRLREEGSIEDAGHLENVAKMIVHHITKFEKEMAGRVEKMAKKVKELEKELGGLKNHL